VAASQVRACSWSGDSGVGSVVMAWLRQRLNSSGVRYTRQLGNCAKNLGGRGGREGEGEGGTQPAEASGG
jgi:hypothetical protein